MADIVERLRKPLGASPDWRFNGKYLSYRSDEERAEAADEIERLRAALEQIEIIGNSINENGINAYALMRCGSIARTALTSGDATKGQSNG